MAQKFLKPDKLDLDPDVPTAEKEYKHWKKTFQNFMTAVLTEDDAANRLNILINFVSPSVFAYFEESTTYDSAFELLDKVYSKQKNEIFVRHLLATRNQQPGETIDEFLRALTSLAKDCTFKNLTAEQHRQESIRDAFVNGMESSAIRQRLLESNEEVTLESAISKARSLDLAQRNSSLYLRTTQCSSVNRGQYHQNTDSQDMLSNAVTKTRRRSCYFCGQEYHPRIKCPARDQECDYCGILGHYESVCSKKRRQRRSSVTATTTSHIASVGVPHCLKRAAVKVKIGNHVTHALLDSGSAESFISKEYATELSLKSTPCNSVVSFASKSSQGRVTGVIQLDIVVKKQKYKSFVFKEMHNLCSDIILGLDFMNLHQQVVFEMNGQRSPFTVSNFSDLLDDNRYCAVAQADVKPPKLFEHLKPNWKPIATKSRRYSLDDRDFISKEVSKLIAEGVIEPSSSPWRAQVLVVNDGRHKKRMVIDFSQTINRYTLLDAYPLPKIDDQVNQISRFKIYSTLDLKSAYYQIPLSTQERPFTAFEACGNLYQYCRIPFGVTNGVSAFQRIIDDIIAESALQGTFAYLDNITICGMDKTNHDFNLKSFLDAAKRFNLTFNHSKSTICSSEIDLLGYRVSFGLIKPDPERLKALLDLPPPRNISELKRVNGLFAYYARWIPQFSDKIRPLYATEKFPLVVDAVEAFSNLKNDLANACLGTIDETAPFTIECDASNLAIAAVLHQGGKPVAFMSRTLTPSESRYSTVEKEASSVIAAVRKWSHYLYGKHFTLVTDQRSVAFMFDSKSKGKIKNSKIQLWRIELGQFSYDIVHKPGSMNVAADTLSRSNYSCAATLSSSNLNEIHDSLGHPGITRLHHFVKSKNLTFSLNEVRETCSRCRICAQIKPNFQNVKDQILVKATRPWERLNVDFKGPLKSSRYPYIFVVIDEYSRFPFAFPCKTTSSQTVISCLAELFVTFGLPGFVHSDRGAAFVSQDVKVYLHSRGVATSLTTPYHPTGNSQCERLNQTLWRTIRLILKSRRLADEQWADVLPDALHSIRSLLCTATNTTPHERFFSFPRQSMLGKSTPSWLLTPGPILLRKFVRNKNDDLCDEVELIEANPTYARVRFPNGRESNVSLNDVAPLPPDTQMKDSQEAETSNQEQNSEGEENKSNVEDCVSPDQPLIRRSTRIRHQPERYGNPVSH